MKLCRHSVLPQSCTRPVIFQRADNEKVIHLECNRQLVSDDDSRIVRIHWLCLILARQIRFIAHYNNNQHPVLKLLSTPKTLVGRQNLLLVCVIQQYTKLPRPFRDGTQSGGLRNIAEGVGE